MPKPTNDAKPISDEWPLYEVFIRSKNGLSHKHAGSLHASDAQTAMEAARDLYTRRQEGVSLWVVPSAQIIASNPKNADALFAPAQDKIYRHPTFYTMPKDAKNI